VEKAVEFADAQNKRAMQKKLEELRTWRAPLFPENQSARAEPGDVVLTVKSLPRR